MSEEGRRSASSPPSSGSRESSDQPELQRALGIEDPAAGSAYVTCFRKEIDSLAFSTATESDAIAAAAGHDVVLLGEYHPLPGACQTAGLLLERLSGTGRRTVLGVEMVHARDQHALDAYLAGRIGRRELAKRIRYEEEWGYPLSWVIRLLAHARDRGIPVVGLDIPPRGSSDDLSLRDGVAAERIAALGAAETGGAPRWVVLFGEAHLAERHLPREIASRVRGRVMRVFHDLAAVRPSGARWLRAGDSAFACQRARPPARARALEAVYRRWAASAPRPTELDVPLLVHELTDGHAQCLGVDPRDRRIGPARWLADAYPSVYAPGERARVLRHLREAGISGSRAREELERAERFGAAFVRRANLTVVARPEMRAISMACADWLDETLAPEDDSVSRTGATRDAIRVAAATTLAQLLTCRVDPRASSDSRLPHGDAWRSLAAAIADRDLEEFVRRLDAASGSEHESARRFGSWLGGCLHVVSQGRGLDTVRLGGRLFPERSPGVGSRERLALMAEALVDASPGEG
ncbi:MAG: ChaN family lipoprotein [Acidobacteriota bacterium]|nr:ChaN family lipoprotein [Acidobacteriota bacterium]